MCNLRKLKYRVLVSRTEGEGKLRVLSPTYVGNVLWISVVSWRPFYLGWVSRSQILNLNTVTNEWQAFPNKETIDIFSIFILVSKCRLWVIHIHIIFWYWIRAAKGGFLSNNRNNVPQFSLIDFNYIWATNPIIRKEVNPKIRIILSVKWIGRKIRSIEKIIT